MNNSTTNTEPYYLIASYGAEGITAMNLFAHSEWIQADKARMVSVKYFQLENHINNARISDLLSGIYMVFILGSDDDITAPPSALALALQCRENDIPCFTALTITALPGQMDSATGSLCDLSSNILQFPAVKPVNNLVSCFLLKEAVMSIISPLLGPGYVGVDHDDFKFIMRFGKSAQFSVAEAKGDQRANQATHKALSYLPNPLEALAIICHMEAGFDFTFDELNAVNEVINQAVSEQCATLTCTTINGSADALIIRIMTFY